MDMKRFLVLGVLGMFLVSLMGFVLGADVSAEAGEAAETVTSAVSGFMEPILSPLFGDTELLSRTFFAMLLGMIIYSIIITMFGSSSKWIQWGITGAITSLALLGLPSNFLEALRTQYGAMGATILTIIPFFIIMIFSIKTKNLLIARMTWIFYAFYYFSMYLYQIFSLASSYSGTENFWLSTETLPYLVAFGIGIGVFFFIPAIRKAIFKGEMEGIIESGMSKVQKRKALQSIQDADLGRYDS